MNEVKSLPGPESFGPGTSSGDLAQVEQKPYWLPHQGIPVRESPVGPPLHMQLVQTQSEPTVPAMPYPLQYAQKCSLSWKNPITGNSVGNEIW